MKVSDELVATAGARWRRF